MKRKNPLIVLAFVLVTCALISCSDDEPADLTGSPGIKGDPGAYNSPIPTAWTKVDWKDHYPDFTYRDLAPSCANCPHDECDPQFFFFAKGGTSNNLIVYFEGGGACWDTSNCVYAPLFGGTYSTHVGTTVEGLNDAGGIANFNNPDNPFMEWNMVYIPYCTGDVHVGVNDYDYPDYLGLHVLPEFNSWTIRHRGKVNFRVVLKWIQNTFTTAPQKIFVAGSSAGAYGAGLNFADIVDAYPSSMAYCFPDAGNGIMPDDDAVFKDLANERWNLQLPWQVPEFIEGTNNFADFSTGELYGAIANHYPDSIVTPYTAAWDHNQIMFYYIMLYIDWWYMPLWQNYYENVDAHSEDWNARMYAVLDDTMAHAAAGNYRYYVGPRCNHTILGSPDFYDELSGGYSLLEWVTQLLDSGVDNLPNVLCTDCDTKPDYLVDDPC